MRTGTTLTVTPADRVRLEAIISHPATAQKHGWRCRIVLLSADGLGTMAIVGATGKSKKCVWRWQDRFLSDCVEGLVREKTRCPGTPKTPDDKIAEVIRLTQASPPHEATHWTLRAMAETVGLAASTVRAIWQAHGLSPRRWRQFKLPNDPEFAKKLTDVVGLYVAPPAHAVVLSVDEKSQIQALDRTQPGLPLKNGRGPIMTHDHKRNGITTLFAALNVLIGTVLSKIIQRHRHQEFIRFLNQIERDVPAGKVILDNYCTHKHANVQEWLARHPRWTFYFIPTSSSWLNAVEGFFAKLKRRRLRHGVFRSVFDLQTAINGFIREHDDVEAKPFVWRADPDNIIAARNRGFQMLNPIH
ncbi:MAG: IS630 family transposase [Pseudomonadota bacterium]